MGWIAVADDSGRVIAGNGAIDLGANVSAKAWFSQGLKGPWIGLIEACLAGAGLFFIVTLIAAGTYMVRKRQIQRQAREHAKSAAHAMLADPMVVAAGLQLVRGIGLKRLIPILAVGGLALGVLAGRNSAAGDQAPAE